MGCCSTTPNDIDKVEYIESSDEYPQSDSEVEETIGNLYKSGELLTTNSYVNNHRLRSTSFCYGHQIARPEGSSLMSDSTQLSLASKKLICKNIGNSFKDDNLSFRYYETCL